ncbi:efflux RND transporter periplasmic adaptor subunit [Daejeonella sp. JGW-45]|uniref:efflux RND transporter periplasmic adaptor subunit n=1 Tax=Daejeonella sp. JGW-45 TaxID=3034148 RepID=UPI0023EC88E3|nr:efflux RND transporter periplasmic adaptor subunit [Daejeonella sp. JGW-45]
MKLLNKIICLSMIGLTVMGCNQTNKEVAVETEAETKVTDEVSLTKDQYKVADIQLGEIEMRNLSNVIKASGELDLAPESMVFISAPLGGYVRSNGLLPGQEVRKGQVVAIIENPEFIDIQQQYLESRSRMEFLQLEYKRQEELRKEDVNSAKTFQQVSSELKMMRARMSGLQQKLSLIGINVNSLQAGRISRTSNLYSPISGYVITSTVNKGKYVMPTDVLFELGDKSDLHLALNVYEKDASRIKVGQSIRFALANSNEYNRVAKVFLIGKATGTEGTVPVHCHIENVGASLIPGMYAKALISVTEDLVTAVPSDAIVNDAGDDYLFIQLKNDAKGYTFKMIPIKRGIEEDNYTEVILPQQFNQGSQLVLKGAYALLSAMKNVEE